jgi:hypothetical protein
MGGGPGGEMTQALYAHMNNERKMEKKKNLPTQVPIQRSKIN